jgi:Lambda phage tail tape-measure protein (Tape_meas_lam_C)
MSQELAALQISLELQSAQFSAEMAKVNGQLTRLNNQAKGVSDGFQKFGNSLKTVFAAGAVVAGMTAMARSLGNIAQEIDDMGKASQKIGVAVESLSALKFAADQSGVSFESLQVGLKKLNQNMAEVGTGTDAASKALRSLGVSASDNTDQALAKIANRFKEMPDGVAKTAAAMDIFGKSGADLIPLLNEGADGMEKLKERARELGVVLSDETVAQITLFNDSLAEIQTAAKGIAYQITAGLAPAMSALAATLSESASAGDAWKALGETLGGLFIGLAKNVNDFVTELRIMKAAVEALGSLDSLRAFSQTRAQIIAESDAFNARLDAALARTASLSATAGAGGGGGGLGGAGTAGPLEKWAQGLKKTADEIDLVGPKMDILITVLGNLEAAGQKGSAQWKAYYAEMKKVQEAAAEGSVGAELTIQIEKLREEAAKTAESMTILSQKYADFLEMGDVEGAQIVLDLMDKLKGKTQETANEFQKLGEGIADAIASNASNAVNSFIDSIGSAKISFGDFAASVLKDIAKMIVQLLIMKPLMDSIKGFIGGGFKFNAHGDAYAGGTSLPQGIYTQPTFFKFANGGIPGSRTGVLAEAGRSEAIVPLIRHGKDLGVKASPVNVNVYNNAGVDVQTQTSEDSDGTKRIDVYIEKKVRDMVNNGGLDRSMRGAYGLTRVGA